MLNTSVAMKHEAKSRWNKNKKKNWKKKIDLSLLEDALDKQRLELRTGRLFRERSDAEIFFVHKQGNHNNALPKRSKQLERLTVDKIILPDPSAVLPKSGRNAAKRRRQKKRQILNKKLSVKEKPGTVTGSCIAVNKEKQTTNLYSQFWEKDAKDVAEAIFGESDIKIHTASVIGKKQVKRPSHLYACSNENVKAVEPAHGGASYNPSFLNHQALLREEHNKELRDQQSEEKLQRALYCNPCDFATEETYASEMMEGLLDSSDSEENVENNSLEGPISNIPQRITKKKRKLLAKLQEEEKQKQISWASKVKENEVYRAKTFLNEIREKEKNSELKKLRKMANVRQPVLSRSRYVESTQDLKLSSEICGSLRQLKPEGNLLVDRYKSLQKRCVIEPRDRFKPPRRKYKVKYQEKRSFRDIEL